MTFYGERSSELSVKSSKTLPRTTVKGASGTFRQVLIGPEEGPNFAMRRFIIEPGGSMPLHRNSVEHEQYVLDGKASISIGDREYFVSKGDVVLIPANVPHRYQTLGDEAFEFLCIVPNKQDELTIL